MKVILTGELKGHGGEGDVIEVQRGFANNYLLPQHRAIPATPGNLKQLQARKHHIEKREAQRLAEAGDYSQLLDGKTVTIVVKVGDAGRLFGSVTAAIIADAIQEAYEVEVDRHKIETHGAIKTIGEHPVEIAVYREIKARLTVSVVGEGAEEQEPGEAEALAAADAQASAAAQAEQGAAEGDDSAGHDAPDAPAAESEPEAEPEPDDAAPDADAEAAED
ncbi:MAG: 50S ribosomal protein L9 [Coriobacteriia bacterium]|nr:50S ribosomal protein L9 [Coriobacteriia bacterium]